MSKYIRIVDSRSEYDEIWIYRMLSYVASIIDGIVGICSLGFIQSNFSYYYVLRAADIYYEKDKEHREGVEKNRKANCAGYKKVNLEYVKTLGYYKVYEESDYKFQKVLGLSKNKTTLLYDAKGEIIPRSERYRLIVLDEFDSEGGWTPYEAGKFTGECWVAQDKIEEHSTDTNPYISGTTLHKSWLNGWFDKVGELEQSR